MERKEQRIAVSRKRKAEKRSVQKDAIDVLDRALEQAHQISEIVQHLRVSCGLSYRPNVYASNDTTPIAKRTKIRVGTSDKERQLDSTLANTLADLLELALPYNSTYVHRCSHLWTNESTDRSEPRLSHVLPFTTPNEGQRRAESSEDELSVAEALVTMSHYLIS